MQWSCNAPIHEIHIVLIKKTGLRLIEETELKKSMRRQLALWSMSSIECRSNASLPILSMNVVVARLSVNCIIVSNRIITGACTMRFWFVRSQNSNSIWKAAQLIGCARDYRRHALAQLFVNDHLSKRSRQVAVSSKWVNLVFRPFLPSRLISSDCLRSKSSCPAPLQVDCKPHVGYCHRRGAWNELRTKR